MEIVGLEDTIKGSWIIFSGDLNFTVSTKEVWGQNARQDPLGPFFIDFLRESGLVDIEPVELKPTWRNGRYGEEGIGKRIEKLYMSKNLVSSVNRFRSWIVGY